MSGNPHTFLSRHTTLSHFKKMSPQHLFLRHFFASGCPLSSSATVVTVTAVPTYIQLLFQFFVHTHGSLHLLWLYVGVGHCLIGLLASMEPKVPLRQYYVQYISSLKNLSPIRWLMWMLAGAPSTDSRYSCGHSTVRLVAMTVS